MIFSEFKSKLENIFWKDTKHTDARIYSTTIMCADEILSKVLAPEMIEIDSDSAVVFRRLDDTHFVRKFHLENSEQAMLDFKDALLIEALMYSVATKLSVDNALYFEQRYFVAINSYLASTRDERVRSIDELLEFNGYKKPYTITKSLQNTLYNWDKGFIKAIDTYINDIEIKLNPSYENFIELFIDYCNGKNDRSDMKSLDKVLSINALGEKLNEARVKRSKYE